MKRSEINEAIREAEAFMAEHRFHLPPFASWTPDDWKDRGPECDEIRRCGLGWDVTDFGRGDFSKWGLLLITLRNGTLAEAGMGGKTYAEKIMVVREGQVTPCHFHWSKREDIINRGGGTLVIRLWNSDAEERRVDTDVTVQTDGVTRTLPGGGTLRLTPGESVTLEPYGFHEFWAEEGTCLVGEVSAVNDDAKDNNFLGGIPRFSEVEEDEPPYRKIVTDTIF